MSREPFNVPMMNKAKQSKSNSLLEYAWKSRQHRIKWNTKLYRIDFDEKKLNEQIDDLIDVAAKEFCIWLNKMSNQNDEYQSKTVKELFSIDVDNKICRSIAINVKQKPAIHKTIADCFKYPNVS